MDEIHTDVDGWDVREADLVRRQWFMVIGILGFSILILVMLLAFGVVQARAETCIASVYGTGDSDQNGSRTASGIPLRNNGSPTIAHKSLPLRSFVTVTNSKTGKSVRAQVTDRGPFVHGRCVDLNHSAGYAIGCGGLCRVSVELAR